MIGQISDEAKPSGKRSAGKPHAAFEVAGAGNGIHLRITAPALDPTVASIAAEVARFCLALPTLIAKNGFLDERGFGGAVLLDFMEEASQLFTEVGERRRLGRRDLV